ncbi:MAG TPA: dTMP kinase [Candidatus Babeliales bacterium]|nr:dTMP kinase [Candidatus Babeliales bacterium]
MKYFLLIITCIATLSQAMETTLPKKTKRGALIAIEGIDGSGKSTLAKHLFNALEEKYRYLTHIVLTKEPGDTEVGKKIREIVQFQRKPLHPVTEYLLFAADRTEHFNKVIIPALQSNSIVISDRLADSSLAYQGYGRRIDKDKIRETNKWAMQHTKPDLTIFVKVPLEVAIERIQKRNEDFSTFEKASFLADVKSGFEEIYGSYTNSILFEQLEKSLQEFCVQKSGDCVNLTTFDGTDFEKIHGKCIGLMTVDGTENEETVARKTIVAVEQWIENHCQ